MKKVIYKVFFLLFLTFPALIYAQEGAANCIETVFGCFNRGEGALKIFIAKAFVWVAGFIGTLSMLGLIYAGFVYITSQGNPDSIGKAKDVIWTSLAALLIIIFSWALFNLLVPEIAPK